MVDGDLSTTSSGAGLVLTIVVAAALLLPWLPAVLPRLGRSNEGGRRNSRWEELTKVPDAEDFVNDKGAATTPASGGTAPPSPDPSTPAPAVSWRCACEGGSFLPPGLLAQSLGGAHAVWRMGTGQCYHKSSDEG